MVQVGFFGIINFILGYFLWDISRDWLDKPKDTSGLCCSAFSSPKDFLRANLATFGQGKVVVW